MVMPLTLLISDRPWGDASFLLIALKAMPQTAACLVIARVVMPLTVLLSDRPWGGASDYLA